MSERLRSDFWVSAYLRRCGVEGVDAVLRRRGSAEAGAIVVKLDHLDGRATLFCPAPQTAFDQGAVSRLFTIAHAEPTQPAASIEERLRREIGFDPDLWIVEVEDRRGRHFLDLADDREALR